MMIKNILSILILIFIPFYSFAEIKVTFTEQSSEGLIDQDLDMETLSFLKEWITEETRSQLASSYKSNGVTYSNIDEEFMVEAQYVTFKGKKLIEFTIDFKDSIFKTKRIMGIVRERLISVGCVSDQGEAIAKYSGPCGEEVNRHFFN